MLATVVAPAGHVNVIANAEFISCLHRVSPGFVNVRLPDEAFVQPCFLFYYALSASGARCFNPAGHGRSAELWRVEHEIAWARSRIEGHQRGGSCALRRVRECPVRIDIAAFAARQTNGPFGAVVSGRRNGASVSTAGPAEF